MSDQPPNASSVPELPFDWRATAMVNPDWSVDDRTPEHRDTYFNLTSDQRVRIMFEMTNDMRQRKFARIREEHPHWIEREVKREFIRQLLLPEPMPPALDQSLQAEIDAERRELGLS